MALTCCTSKSLILWWILRHPSLHSSIPWKEGGGGEMGGRIEVAGEVEDA